MRKRLVLLQALAILMAVFQYDTRAAGQDEERYSNRILSNVFYPNLTARYVQKCIWCDVAYSHLHTCMRPSCSHSHFYELQCLSQ